jgi:hypothetical protein
MKSIYNICNENITNSLHSLYEASILDIDGTIEDGDKLSDIDKLISKVFSSSSKDDFNNNLDILIKSIKATYKRFDEDDLKKYYSGNFDKSQIFIALYNDKYADWPQHQNKLKYCDAYKSGEIRWYEESHKKISVKNRRYSITLKNDITDCSRIFDIYMVPDYARYLWENLMKKRKY